MTTKTIPCMRTALLAAALTLATTASLQAQTVLFSDTFNRPNSLNISADTNGMSGSAAPMTYKETDSQVPNDSLTQITNNLLGLATGPNASTVGLESHNFIDSQILTDGGFSISMDMQNLANQTTVDHYCGFGVGISATEMAALTLDFNLNTGPRGNFGSGFTGVADFFVCYTPNSGGDVQIFFQGIATGTQFDVNVGNLVGTTANLRADFYPAGFGAGDNVDVYVFMNNSLVVKTNFTWQEANQNYLALSCRQSAGFLADNLLVQTIAVANAPLFWVGDGGANLWDTNNLNWSNSVSGLITKFTDGKNANFSDSSVNTNVSVSGTVNPGSLTVNNSVNQYTISGGVIGGSGGLSKLGTNLLTLSASNSFSGGTMLSAGRLRVGHNHALGSGLVQLGGGALSAEGAVARTLPNPVRITIASTLGNATDNGVLTLAGPVDFNAGGRTLTVNSDVVFGAGASSGRIGVKQGPGTLTLKGVVDFSGGSSDVKEGTVIIDGGAVTNTDRLIVDAEIGTGVARLVITNGGSLTTLGGVNNLRVGRASPVPGTNIVDLAGLYSTPNAGTGNGRILLQNVFSLYSELNFLPGGEYSARAVAAEGGGGNPTVINLNGGLLRALENTATFFEGIGETYVRSGGAKFDDGGFAITINQALMDGGGGGLTKLGAGTLTLGGFSTYTGSTVVSNGTLVINAGVLSGGGPLMVANNATLVVTNTGSSQSASALTMGSGGTSNLRFDFPTGNPAGATIVAGTLTGTGTATIHISGQGLAVGQFPLIQFTSASGLGNFVLGSLPLGVTASLVQTANSLNLNVTAAGRSLQWSSSPADNNWNTTSVNWLDIGNGYTPTTYVQFGGLGDRVFFAGSATTAINLPSAVTPVGMTIENSAPSYSFTGAGKISGAGDLIMNTFATLTLGTVNDYTGGTVVNAGTVQAGANQALGTGPVTLNLGVLSSDGATARTLPNRVVLNADTGVIFGDTINPGAIELTGGLDLAGGLGRSLNLNSDLIVSGALTNGALVSKTGPGTLHIRGNATLLTAAGSQLRGDVVVDGGFFSLGDGWRLQGQFPGETLRLVVTNGGVLNVSTGINTGNLRIGLTGGDGSANHVLDVSGTVNVTPPGTVGANSAISLGQSGADNTLYLRPGGLLVTRALVGLAPGNSVARFMGGTMRPIANTSGFISALNAAYMENGGLTIDTTNFAVTVPQALLASGNGGLTKTGAGTLTLSGANTYTGGTFVNAGKLVLADGSAAPGGISVVSNATLAFLSGAPGITVRAPGATNAHGSFLEAQFAGLVANPTAPAGFVTNLTVNGTVGVNVIAANITSGQLPLIGYQTLSGGGSLVLGQLPQGVIATLVTNTGAKTIDLVVSSVEPVVWSGAVSGDWDTTTTNWTLTGLPIVYNQGDNVRFDDTASNAVVALTMALSPGGVTVSNSALAYQFNNAGSGSLVGSMSLTKDGPGSLTLGTPNTFLGAVTVKAGTLVTANATALGATNGATTIQPGASLNVNGINLGLEPVILGGSGAGGTGALRNTGPDQNNVLRDVTLTADTVIECTGVIGIRMPDDTDPGIKGNGYKLTKTGAGQLNLNGGQATAGSTIWDCDLGDVDILSGTLSFQRRITMGRTANTVTVSPGATLLLFALSTSMPVQTKPVALNSATLSATGNNATEGTTFGGPVTLTGANTLSALTGVTFTLDGPISGSGSITSSGLIVLGGTNTYTGRTVVTNGTLTLMHSSALSGSTNITLQNNGILNVTAVAPWMLGAAQTLGGTGTVNGSVVANGTLAPGSSVGTLTIGGDLTLNGGLDIEVDKSLAQSNDVISVAGSLANTGSGTVTVKNLGVTPLAAGDTFTLFSQPVANGGALSVVGAGATWTNNLATDGSISVLSVGPAAPTPTNLTYSVIGGSQLVLSWPVGEGWRLERQTNALAVGLKTNWVEVATEPPYTNAVNVAPTVFFRLVYP